MLGTQFEGPCCHSREKQTKMMWIFSFGIWFSGVILKADCATRLSVKNNQYDNLLFAVAPHVPADNAQLLLENIKVVFLMLDQIAIQPKFEISLFLLDQFFTS